MAEYSELDAVKRDFEPILKLWSITSLFHTSHAIWMNGAFVELCVKCWHRPSAPMTGVVSRQGSGEA